VASRNLSRNIILEARKTRIYLKYGQISFNT
jgi:hypothetical protein